MFRRVLLLAILGLAACATRPVPEIRLHTLEYAPPALEAPPLAATVRVARFGVAPALRTPALVASQPYLRADIPLERWRALPSALAADFLRRDLAASGAFTAVVDAGSSLPADYQVEGMVEEWSEYRDGSSRTARLGLTVTLVATQAPLAEAVLFQRRYDDTEPCAQGDGTALARAMSQAMARVSARVARDVHEAIAARLQGRGPGMPR